MILKQCMLVNNDCYKRATKIKNPIGVVVHSTGANNPNLKRYVQPDSSNPNYKEILGDLGKNTYNNHWNRSSTAMGRSVCVHAFIGKNDKGEVETYQTLPFDVCCWGVGKGNKGSYNYNPTAKIQFEICEDNLGNEEYFNKVMLEAQEFCAYLCKTLNMPVSGVCSHHEAALAGYGSNHADIDHWLRRYDKDMNWFRSRVSNIMKGEIPLGVTESAKPTPAVSEDKPQEESKPEIGNSFLVRVTVDSLNIRNGAGMNYKINGVIRGRGVYTIVETKGDWGKLKSGAGWINLGYTSKL